MGRFLLWMSHLEHRSFGTHSARSDANHVSIDPCKVTLTAALTPERENTCEVWFLFSYLHPLRVEELIPDQCKESATSFCLICSMWSTTPSNKHRSPLITRKICCGRGLIKASGRGVCSYTKKFDVSIIAQYPFTTPCIREEVNVLVLSRADRTFWVYTLTNWSFSCELFCRMWGGMSSICRCLHFFYSMVQKRERINKKIHFTTATAIWFVLYQWELLSQCQ